MLNSNFLVIFVFLYSATTSSWALYGPSSDVIELTPSNFDSLVLRSNEVWLVEFYAPWCGHCKKLVPEFEKAAKALKGAVKLGSVNADEHKNLGERYNVQGFPTILVFKDGKNTKYSGDRTAMALAKAAMKTAQDRVMTRLGKEVKSYNKWIKGPRAKVYRQFNARMKHHRVRLLYNDY